MNSTWNEHNSYYAGFFSMQCNANVRFIKHYLHSKVDSTDNRPKISPCVPFSRLCCSRELNKDNYFVHLVSPNIPISPCTRYDESSGSSCSIKDNAVYGKYWKIHLFDGLMNILYGKWRLTWNSKKKTKENGQKSKLN